MTSVSLLRAERVAERRELGNQLLVVVDLAVVDDDDAAVLVAERLLAGATSMIDSRRWPRPTPGSTWQTDFVGTAVMLRLVHPREHRRGSISRAPRVSKIPVMPHMARSSSAMTAAMQWLSAVRSGGVHRVAKRPS